ncbi:MAG: hypothetical protein ACAH83_05865 [Alphaproteobacteria bacterium]
MAKKEPKSMHELHVRAMFEAACAGEGLTGPKIEEAAERFIETALNLGVKISFPKKTYLSIGVSGKTKPSA